MRHARASCALSALGLLLVAGCGSDHDTPASRGGNAQTIDVEMVDNSFRPLRLEVSQGETVTIRFNNAGAIRHEGVVGDQARQEEHHDEMLANSSRQGSDSTEMDEMGHSSDDDEGDVVTVEPGETAELTHTFDDEGTVIIGCHEPGHWEAGMKITVTVA